ncbi:MAG: hypothetical protein AB9844_12855 [Clostridiaceae bacterium]
MSSLSAWQIVLFQVAFFAVIMLVVYRQIKERVLYKYNPDKWMILIAAGLIFLIPIIAGQYLNFDMTNTVWQYVDSAIFIVLFLWFVDIQNGSIKKLQLKKAGKAEEEAKTKEKQASSSNRKKNKNRDQRRRK